MKEPRKQHLSEAVAGLISTIVKMMLGLLRARGLRGLLELPTLFRFVRDLRRLAEEFSTLFAAFKAGIRPVSSPGGRAPPRESGNPRLRARPQRHASESAPAPQDPAALPPESRASRALASALRRPLRPRAPSPSPVSPSAPPARQKIRIFTRALRRPISLRHRNHGPRASLRAARVPFGRHCRHHLRMLAVEIQQRLAGRASPAARARHRDG